MSSFKCDKCKKPILDTQMGYITYCTHYPKEVFYGSQFKNKKVANAKRRTIEWYSKLMLLLEMCD